MNSKGFDENAGSRAAQGDVKFWRTAELGDLELLHASYAVQSFPRHMHEEYILGVMVRGVEGLRHRGATHIAPAGSVLIINPCEWHANYALDEAGYAYRTLYPSVDLMKRFAQEISGRDQDAPLLRQPVVADDEKLSRLLLSLHLALEQNVSSLEQEARLLDAVAHLLAHHSTVPPASPSLRREHHYVKWVRDYLQANYADNVSLAELGEFTGVSPFHLLRVFRDEVGLPPHEYQTHIRIARAKRLLRSGRRVVEVAAEVGFTDQSHLTRHFKRIVGVTPGRFSSDRNNIQDEHTGPQL